MDEVQQLIQKHVEFRERMAADGWKDGSDFLKPGIYFLIKETEVIYIGRADCLLVRIYSHFTASNSSRKTGFRNSAVAGVKFDDVKIMPIARHRLGDVEREMIAKYRPRYNKRLKPPLEAKPKQKLPIGFVARITGSRTLDGFVRRV